MKLVVRHTFPCSPEVFWQAFWEPAYDDRLQQGSTTVRELVEDHQDGTVRTQRYRFAPARPLPGPIAAVVGTDRLVYDQENRWDAATGVLTWKVRPNVIPDKITAEGTFTVRPAPDGCERLVEGKIEVRVPFVGGRVEQAIVTDVEAGYEIAARVTRDYLIDRARS